MPDPGIANISLDHLIVKNPDSEIAERSFAALALINV